MDVGLLWYDGESKRPLEDKISRAAHRYHEKHGRWPNTCFVHPHVAEQGPGEELRLAYRLRDRDRTASIRVLAAPNVLRHHLWLGEDSDLPIRHGNHASRSE